MLQNPIADALMQDAHAMQSAALQCLEADDWRDAAEKAWCAARNATKALVLEVDEAESQRSTKIEVGMRNLARQRGGEWLTLRGRYSEIVHYLHAEAFYDGSYTDDVPDLVRQVSDYIELAEKLSHS